MASLLLVIFSVALLFERNSAIGNLESPVYQKAARDYGLALQPRFLCPPDLGFRLTLSLLLMALLPLFGFANGWLSSESPS